MDLPPMNRGLIDPGSADRRRPDTLSALLLIAHLVLPMAGLAGWTPVGSPPSAGALDAIDGTGTDQIMAVGG